MRLPGLTHTKCLFSTLISPIVSVTNSRYLSSYISFYFQYWGSDNMTMGNTPLSQAPWDLVPDHVDEWMYVHLLYISTRLAVITHTISLFLYLNFSDCQQWWCRPSGISRKLSRSIIRPLKAPELMSRLGRNQPKPLKTMKISMGLAQCHLWNKDTSISNNNDDNNWVWQ